MPTAIPGTRSVIKLSPGSQCNQVITRFVRSSFHMTGKKREDLMKRRLAGTQEKGRREKATGHFFLIPSHEKLCAVIFPRLCSLQKVNRRKPRFIRVSSTSDPGLQTFDL